MADLVEVLRMRNPETDPDCHEAADEIERLRGKGTWSTSPPDEPGWYWWREADGTKRVIRVFGYTHWPNQKQEDLIIFHPISKHEMHPFELKGEWYSERINEPE